MARRGENIRKRKDNRWEGRFTVFDERGNRKTCSVYGKTYCECKEKLKRAKENGKSFRPLQQREWQDRTEALCLDTVALAWLEEVQKTKKQATYIKYRSVYEKHIQAILGQVALNWEDRIANRSLFEDKKISESLYQSIISVLQQILRYGTEHFDLKEIQLEHTKKFAKKKKRIEALSAGEQNQLLNYLYHDMDIYKMGILLSLSTGLRLGELCALKWSNIDFGLKLLRVDRTVQRIAIDGTKTKTELVEDVPKTPCSVREIPLSDNLLNLLRHYKTDSAYVFCKIKPMEPRTYQNRFKSYLRNAGINQNKSFHILRHTFATNCIECGTDVKSLSEILGHSDVKITLNRYVHPSFEVKRKYMNTLSAILGKKVGQIL